MKQIFSTELFCPHLARTAASKERLSRSLTVALMRSVFSESSSGLSFSTTLLATMASLFSV